MLHSEVGSRIAEALKASAMWCPSGCFVEVGVYKGGTAQYLLAAAIEQGRAFYGYDTFTGIPYKDPIDSHVVGDFRDTSLAEVSAALPGAILTAGIFPDSAVRMPLIAFAHLDCDQYKSVREATMYLEPRMAIGGIIWFDDYMCLDGATKAVDELYAGRLQKHECGKYFVRF